MTNWRSFGHRMLNCRRSMLNTWCICSNPARFHHFTSGGGLLSPVRLSSSDYFRRLGGGSVRVLNEGATFSSTATADVVVVEEEEAIRGPLPLRSAPCLMLPAGTCLVAQSDEDDGERLKLVKMKEKEEDCYRFFSLGEEKVVKMKPNLMLPWQRELLPPYEAICFGSSRGWLAFIHPRNCSLYLFNPFIHSYLPYLPLPPIQTLPFFISTLRYRRNSNIQNSSSSYNNNKNKIVTEFTNWKHVLPMSSQELSHSHFFKKIVLSSAPSPFPSNHHRQYQRVDNQEKYYSSDCTVMAIHGYCEYKLAFCRIGDTAWTTLDSGYSSDVMYFSKDQKFYALSGRYMEAWDLCDPASPKKDLIMSHLPPYEHSTMDEQQRYLRTGGFLDRYLVESLGELLMVVRHYGQYFDKNGEYHPDILFDHTHPKGTVAFDVYKLDFVNKDWVLLPGLGNDRALFIGFNDSVSVSAIDFPGLDMNCIYFTSPKARSEHSHDLGIFDLEDNCISPIYQYDLKNIKLPSPWIVPAAQQ